MRDYAALVALLNARAARPYEWGSDKHDCGAFANAAVFAQTGDDVLKRLGLKWSGERSARRLIGRWGGLDKIADAGLTRLPGPAFAHRGDIALVPHEAVESLGVVEGHLVVLPGPTGLVRLQRAIATAAWSAEWNG